MKIVDTTLPEMKTAAPPLISNIRAFFAETRDLREFTAMVPAAEVVL
jgi:hypothetical protein